MDIQEEEDKNNQQSTRVVMKIEVERRMPYINVVTSDDGVNKDTPTVTSSVLYWGNTKRYKQDIL